MSAHKNNYNCKPIAKLETQLLFSPQSKRQEQIHLAEKLHDEITGEANYPFDYIAYRITRHRRDSNENILLVGQAILPDLRLLIDSLSKSIELSIDDEPTQTISQLAAAMNVNPKTIERWRKDGLRWRWVNIKGKKRKYIGITQKAIQHFTAANPKRTNSATTFSQISPSQHQELLDKAVVLASQGKTLHKAAAELAKTNNRATETIRLILEKHDKQNPDKRIFPDLRKSLTEREKRIIYRARQIGISTDKLKVRFNCSQSRIYRVINQMRASQARQEKISWITSPTFTRKDADIVFLRKDEIPDTDNTKTSPKVSLEKLPAALKEIYDQPNISEKRKRSLFLRYNYLKFKADKVRQNFGRYEVKKTDLDNFENTMQQVKDVRSFLIRLGLPVVLSVARRHQIGSENSSTNSLLLLLEIGFDELIKSVEKYNANLSKQFNSFLTNQLLGRFARESDKQAKSSLAHKRITGTQALEYMQNIAQQENINLNKDV